MDMISHSSNDLVGLWGGKLDSKPSLLWKRQRYCWEITQLSREIECILSIWFLSPKQVRLILSLAANALLLLKTPLTQLSTQIDLTNSEHVSHRWNFPPWRSSELLRSLTVWALMDALMALMKRGKKPDEVQTFPLNLAVLCPHLLSFKPALKNRDAVTQAAS